MDYLTVTRYTLISIVVSCVAVIFSMWPKEESKIQPFVSACSSLNHQVKSNIIKFQLLTCLANENSFMPKPDHKTVVTAKVNRYFGKVWEVTYVNGTYICSRVTERWYFSRYSLELLNFSRSKVMC